MLNKKVETNMAEKPLEEAISLGQSDVGGSTKMLKWKVLHTNRKPFKCPEPYCFKTYRFQGSVSKHQKQVHRGEKLFKCPEEGCFKAFKFKCQTQIDAHQGRSFWGEAFEGGEAGDLQWGEADLQ